MEFPRRDVIAGRALAVVLMGAAAGVAVYERTHPVPPEFRLELGTPPMVYHARYDAQARLLDLGYGEPPSGLPVMSVPEAFPGGDEPAQGAKDWFFSRPLRLPRSLLELELLRLRPEQVRPAWLPWVEAPPAHEPVTVEILNGSGKPGVASVTKKLLRLKGADVVSTGNSDTIETRTLVYDRTGRHDNAQAVRAALGCESAAAVTKVDPKRLVDVTVVIADDCPMQ